MPHDDILYELKGESWDSAARIYTLLEKTKNLTNDDERIGDIFRRTASHLMEDIGQNHSVTRVYKNAKQELCAYKEQPKCFALPTGDTIRFYLSCPVGYKGDAFKPKDGVALGHDQQKIIYSGLYGGGWTDPLRILPTFLRNAEIPMDFNEENHNLVPIPDVMQFAKYWTPQFYRAEP